MTPMNSDELVGAKSRLTSIRGVPLTLSKAKTSSVNMSLVLEVNEEPMTLVPKIEEVEWEEWRMNLEKLLWRKSTAGKKVKVRF